ncbi:neprilysin-2-like [Microplitis mediator]|uniref:neprilysin-2-like n=1 Tax=Microplitis mediator TaxID=375433 RepID=UPI00255263EC|nr:neprilysin-2-like [Microplitis mediator]
MKPIRRNTPRMQGLLVVAIIGTICSIIQTEAASLVSPPKEPEHKCTEDECVVERLQSAARMLKYRNPFVEPCDNFYRFVCGFYNDGDITATPQFYEWMRDATINGLIGDDDVKSEFKPFKLIQDFHETCMNEELSGEQDLTALKEGIKSLGGWPILEGDKWKEDDFDWIEFTGKSKAAGVDLIYFMGFEPELLPDGTENKLIFNLEKTPNDIEHILSAGGQESVYESYIAEVVKLLGMEGNVDEEVKKIVEFEEKLYQIDGIPDSDEDQIMPVDGLKTRIPGMDWEKLVSKTLTPFMDADDKPFIKIWDADAVQEMIKLIDSTPKRVQANYAIWKIVQFAVEYLTPAFREARNKFYKEVEYDGIDRELVCDEMTKEYVGEAIAFFYMSQYSDGTEIIYGMTEAIKKTMVEMVKESTKFNDTTKEEASKLIMNLPITIGPSAKLSDPTALEKLYEGVEVDKESFLKTLVTFNILRLRLDYSSKLNSDYHFDEEEEDDSNPGLPENHDGHIYVPTKMLSSSIFNGGRPLYMNFGAGGMTLAHEIYPAVAALADTSDQADCFSHLFDDLKDPELQNVTTEATVHGVGAQFIAFKAAYRAYKSLIAEIGPEKPLPEIPYTPEQLFWISYAGSFCASNQKDEGEDDDDDDDKEDSLSLPETTVMRILRNIPEISADFQCAVGTPLNPEKKCTWW